MNKNLAELIKISNAAGKDPTFVQGGGGNTSVKTDDGKSMYIKASGTALKQMSAKKGWRKVNLDAVRSIIKDKSLLKLPEQKRQTKVVNRLLLACDDNIKDGSRPSIETHLHSYLDKCVIHLHPSAVGAYVNAKNGKANIEKLFKNDKFPPLWVPYADPGFLLAKRISKLTADYKAKHEKPPAVLFLDKHGLFVTAATPASAIKMTRQVIAECNKKLKQPKAKIKNISRQAVSDAKLCVRKAYFDATGQSVTISYFYGQEIESFMREKNVKSMLSGGPLAPDELVYSNGPAMWVDKPRPDQISARLKLQIKRGNKPSIAFLVKDLGLLVVGKKKIAQTMREIAESSFFVRANAYQLGGIRALTKKEQDFINKWES
jgi:rhamnose utilization protein RhaD (predicted bifunctional aldolase and dehydrogenase)